MSAEIGDGRRYMAFNSVDDYDRAAICVNRIAFNWERINGFFNNCLCNWQFVSLSNELAFGEER